MHLELCLTVWFLECLGEGASETCLLCVAVELTFLFLTLSFSECLEEDVLDVASILVELEKVI